MDLSVAKEKMGPQIANHCLAHYSCCAVFRTLDHGLLGTESLTDGLA